MGLCESKPAPKPATPAPKATAQAPDPAPDPALLSSMSILDIPFEILVPFLKVEGIGALSMVNKDLNESCGDKLVWRDLYLRTLADTRTCKNRKSYKITVLSKMNTEVKKHLRKTQERLDKVRYFISKEPSQRLFVDNRPLLVYWEEKLRAEAAELTEATAKSARLNQAIQSLKAEAQKAIDDKKVAAKAEKAVKKKAEKAVKKKAVKKAVKKTVKETVKN